MKKFNMKKTTAAAVAAAVGAALLLGGAGTLAYWSDNAETTAQTISSGDLDFGTIANDTWKIQQVVTTGTPSVTKKTASVDFKPDTMKIVPGDVLTRQLTLPVTLVGQNIAAELTVAPIAVPAALTSAVTQEVFVNGTKVTAPVKVTTDATIKLVVTFDWNATNATKLISNYNFGAAYTLTQVAAGTVTP
ncbi:alternate-type signal peptide domain-containing protein [Mycetocola manganoxydans]|uniref:Alternate-type signal peptide domain-containing protein n=1 Tax=Mycetocola manganoxydans TaxID=699879 RepID=A0A3L6ZY13_9MICO|nr:alternate-type signal peptide domain-containing protein [Mycetocola manganoxydans]RLP72916.1 alternate-type signal peptide domain-containing protein [Mycetocola manganoxydans]GHD45001.1 hypothetical protein GCM10008097_13710 [Mycetocola manganoxydans]